MIKTKTVTITEEREVPTHIQCDKCKQEFDIESNVIEVQEFVRIGFQGGYGSVWGDGTNVKVDICQQCFYEMAKAFANAEEGEPDLWYNR